MGEGELEAVIDGARDADESPTPSLPGGEDAVKAMEISERMAECEKHKTDGNQAFQNGEYGQAILLYSMVIDKTQVSRGRK